MPTGFKAVVEHSVVAGKVHLSIYVQDGESIKLLRELKNSMRDNSDNVCSFSTTGVESPNLAGLFVRIK